MPGTGRWSAGGALALVLASGCVGCRTGPGKLIVHVVASLPNGPPLIGATVALQGMSLVAITNASGTATINPIAPGSYVLRTTAAGLCTGTTEVLIPEGTTVEITVSPCVSSVDQVIINNNTSGVDAWTLLDRLRTDGSTTDCANDEIYSSAFLIDLARNALPLSGTPPCASSLTIFSRSAGVFRLDGPPWTVELGDAITTVLPDTRTPLPLRFWITSSDAGTKNIIVNVHLKTMEDLFSDNRVGIVASWSPSDMVTMAEVAPANPTEQNRLKSVIGTTCNSARAIAREPTIYRADALNVYYVDDLTDPSGSTSVYGWYCYQQGVPNILFMWADDDREHMLAHEVGHALGLVEPRDGHAFPVAGYQGLEADHVMGYDTGSHTKLTIGQIFRMSLSRRSWINAPIASGFSSRDLWRLGLGMAVEAPIDCPCDSRNPSPLPCPRITLGIGWPPPAATAPHPACQASGLPATVTLNCGEVSPNFPVVLKDEAGNPVTGGTGYWDLDNPRVASVQPDATTRGAKITALHAGTARVTVYVGGPSASQSINVTVPPSATCLP